jgi:hypothetical protein
VTLLVLKDQQQYGPYELSELQGYVTQGSFALTDLCWQEGWPEWRPLSTVVRVPPPPPAVPPAPTVAATVATPTAGMATGEEILWEGHTTWWKYAGAIFWTVLIGLTVGVFTFGVGLLLIPAFLFLFYLERKRRRFVVTTKRIKAEWGLLTKSSSEVRIRDIRAMNVRRTGLAGFFGIGTLEFSSAAGGGVEVAFTAIQNAQDVKEIVTRQQD